MRASYRTLTSGCSGRRERDVLSLANISSASPVPSVRLDQRSKCFRSDRVGSVNAICVPSGDHTGSMLSWPSSNVTLRAGTVVQLLDSRCRRCRCWGSPSSLLEYATEVRPARGTSQAAESTSARATNRDRLASRPAERRDPVGTQSDPHSRLPAPIHQRPCLRHAVRAMVAENRVGPETPSSTASRQVP